MRPGARAAAVAWLVTAVYYFNQTTFTPPLFGGALGVLLTFFLTETGPAIRLPEQVTARGGHGSNSWNGKVRSAAR